MTPHAPFNAFTPDCPTTAEPVLIPIRVGPLNSLPEAEGAVQLDESGELIISLPAQEFP